MDLYLEFELKIAQENQVQEVMCVLFTDVRTKYSDNEFRLRGHLLMSKQLPNKRFHLLVCMLMSGWI